MGEIVMVGSMSVTNRLISKYGVDTQRPENQFGASFSIPSTHAVHSKNIDQGTQHPLCSGEYGREVLEIAVALQESDLRGRQKMGLPLASRSLKRE